jgi:hypothetical protein
LATFSESTNQLQLATFLGWSIEIITHTPKIAFGIDMLIFANASNNSESHTLSQGFNFTVGLRENRPKLKSTFLICIATGTLPD